MPAGGPAVLALLPSRRLFCLPACRASSRRSKTAASSSSRSPRRKGARSAIPTPSSREVEAPAAACAKGEASPASSLRRPNGQAHRVFCGAPGCPGRHARAASRRSSARSFRSSPRSPGCAVSDSPGGLGLRGARTPLADRHRRPRLSSSVKALGARSAAAGAPRRTRGLNNPELDFEQNQPQFDVVIDRAQGR